MTRSQALSRLQADALSLLPGEQFVNGLGDRFEPHATLLVWHAQAMLPALPVDHALLNTKEVKAFLTLGRSGPQYQYEKVLYR